MIIVSKMIMGLIIGFLIVAIPYACYLFFQAKRQCAAAKEYHQRLLDQKADARLYRDLCRRSGMSPPLSTDDFYGDQS